MAQKVLIVEDNELNRRLFSDLLNAYGYVTIETASGKDAVKLAHQHSPDLVLMDIQLPEVSGIEVIGWFKADRQLRHIPIIAVTAFAMKGDEERILEAGCDAYMAKPISVMKFSQVVQHFLKPDDDLNLTAEKSA